MGLQAQDTLGWTAQDDPNQYKGDFNIKKKVGTVNSNITATVVTTKQMGNTLSMKTMVLKKVLERNCIIIILMEMLLV